MSRQDKHVRSVRLDDGVYKRLLALSEHLGVTPNAYIISAIGKAISHDEMSFLAKQSQLDFFEKLALEAEKELRKK